MKRIVLCQAILVLIVGFLFGGGHLAFAAPTIIEEAGRTIVKNAEGDTPVNTRAVFPQAPDIIFSNFGPGDTYNPSTGWTLSVGQPVGADNDQGDAFTPSGSDFVLEKIELAVGLVLGPNELDVWLMDDTGGQPGNIIEAFKFSGAMGPFGQLNPPLAANSVLKPVLKNGTQYWLIASTPGPDEWAAWNLNSTNDTGPHAFRADTGPWNISNTTRGAFRISGSKGRKDARDRFDKAPPLSRRHKLTTTWGAIKKR